MNDDAATAPSLPTVIKDAIDTSGRLARLEVLAQNNGAEVERLRPVVHNLVSTVTAATVGIEALQQDRDSSRSERGQILSILQQMCSRMDQWDEHVRTRRALWAMLMKASTVVLSAAAVVAGALWWAWNHITLRG